MTEPLALQEQFQNPAQQRSADVLGMYIFLATEVMLFGGYFAAIYAYRKLYPGATQEAAQHLKLWLGGANTAILLTSSLFVALAVKWAREGEARRAALWLVLAAACGIAFLGVKGVEYHEEFVEGLLPFSTMPFPMPHPASRIFINLYFVGTAMHAVHLTVGILLVTGLAWRIARGSAALPQRAITVEMVGLYWHLVDVIWVFIYPILYLARS